MNKQRKERFNDVISTLEDAKSELDDIQTEEQEAYDNLSDGLQMSRRGETMLSYIDRMTDACDKIDSVMDFITDKLIK